MSKIVWSPEEGWQDGPEAAQFGYVALFGEKRIEIWASSLFAAKQAALAEFKPAKSKRHLVSVHLCETPAGPVVHVADF